jgi:hypothetical protein
MPARENAVSATNNQDLDVWRYARVFERRAVILLNVLLKTRAREPAQSVRQKPHSEKNSVCKAKTRFLNSVANWGFTLYKRRAYLFCLRKNS